MNNNIVSIKRISAIFLAIILVTGTIALYPSFMINAQAQPYYYGVDNNYYKSQKDSNSKNININKIKCINTNLNINGNNTGNVNLGNKGGLAAEEGYVGGYSSTGGYGGGYDGHGKQGKGFTCIINNNNTNTNIVIGGGGNETELSACEECFSVNSTLQAVVEDFLINQTTGLGFISGSDSLLIPGDVDTIEQLCPLLEGHTDVLIGNIITRIVEVQTGSITGFEAAIDALIECLLEAGVIVEGISG